MKPILPNCSIKPFDGTKVLPPPGRYSAEACGPQVGPGLSKPQPLTGLRSGFWLCHPNRIGPVLCCFLSVSLNNQSSQVSCLQQPRGQSLTQLKENLSDRPCSSPFPPHPQVTPLLMKPSPLGPAWGAITWSHFSLSDQVSNCLSEMSTWMQDHHLHLDLGEAQLLVFLANRSITT